MINRIRYANETTGPLAELYIIDSELRILEARPNIRLAGSQGYWTEENEEKRAKLAEEVAFHRDCVLNFMSAFGYTEADMVRIFREDEAA
jgi:hypothetical protein